jgi:hypothetical protein
MAEIFRFPLCQPSELGVALNFDFETVRTQAQECFAVMRRFLKSLPQ